MAAFYWVPALLEQDLMRVENLVSSRYDFHTNFPTLVDLFGYQDFYSTGPATPILLLAATCVLCWRRSRLLAITLGGALACLALVFRSSTPLWESLPFLPLFTFPWRFVGPAALLTALAGAIAFALACRTLSRNGRLALESMVFALCIVSASTRVADVPLIGFEVSPSLAQWLEPEAIRKRPARIGFANEYLAPGASPVRWRREPASLGPVAVASERVEWSVLQESGGRILLDIAAPSDSRLKLRRFAAPLWRAEREGRELVTFTSSAGRLGVELPAGRGEVELMIRTPLSRKLGLAISAVAWALFAGLAICILIKRGPRVARQENLDPPRD